MLQGVLDAAERLAAVIHPLGSRVMAFSLKASHFISEVVSGEDLVCAFGDEPGAKAFFMFCCRPAGSSTCSKLWLKRPTEGLCRGRSRRRRGL